MGELNVQARLVPGPRGWRWLTEGWKLFRAAPLAWIVLVGAYFMSMSIIGIIPILGVIAVPVLIPAISVAFMTASRMSERGETPRLPVLIAGFRENLRAQLILGGVYFACISAIFALSALIDDGALARLFLTGVTAAEQRAILQSEELRMSFLVAVTLYLPVMMLFWFAPVLVAWHAMPAAKALFFSLFACLMNWRAFSIYGIAALVPTLVAPILLGSVLVLLFGKLVRPELLATFIFPMFMAILSLLFASFYASYRDIFAPAPEQVEETLSQE
jgi:hypothetical protein